MLTSVIHIFNVDISNISIRYIWLNATYIVSSFCRAILYCDRAIVPNLCYKKCILI